jgi:exosortase/archaeosortase
MGTIIWVVVLLVVAYVVIRAVPDIARYIRMRRM